MKLWLRYTATGVDRHVINLLPGPLEKKLRTEAQDSKFFIVICSWKAFEEPEYLDKELRYFLAGENAADRVIPFIVDDSNEMSLACGWLPRTWGKYIVTICKYDTL